PRYRPELRSADRSCFSVPPLVLAAPAVHHWSSLGRTSLSRGPQAPLKTFVSRRNAKFLLASKLMTGLVTLGQRLRLQRKSKCLTLEQLSEAVCRAPSQLSLIEN